MEPLDTGSSTTMIPVSFFKRHTNAAQALNLKVYNLTFESSKIIFLIKKTLYSGFYTTEWFSDWFITLN